MQRTVDLRQQPAEPTRMNDATSQSNNQQTSEQHSSQYNHPGATTGNYVSAMPPEPDDWDYPRRGPRPLASLGNRSWVNRAERERLAKQQQGEDTTYTHHWTLKDLCTAQMTAIAKDAQKLANMWGKKLQRSADEPEAPPVFSPSEIRFKAAEHAADDFLFPPTGRNDEQAGHGSCNTDMTPYDQLVATTLLAIKHHLGDDVEINAAGHDNSDTWSAAKNLYYRTFPDRDVRPPDNWPGAKGIIRK